MKGLLLQPAGQFMNGLGLVLKASSLISGFSHIFCTACSELLGLSAIAGNNRLCPACHTSLPNPDDAVLTKLNPTEDYKTSVLSGLAPSIIMECAGRGLAFWSYQSMQEMCALRASWRREQAEHNLVSTKST